MFEKLKDNFKRLIALYEAEKEKNGILSAELEKTRAENLACRKQIADLEKQLDNLKLTEAFKAGGNSSAAAKEKIDKMIRDIDKCISLLEK